MKTLLKWLSLNHRSLAHQPLFWLAMGLPFFLFVVFGFIAWYGSSAQWDWQGFNNFIEMTKLPLGLLALAVPFTALVTSIHRSIQTAKQITETERKSNFDVYTKHYETTTKSLSDNGIKNPWKAYKLTFKEMSPKKINLKAQIIQKNQKNEIEKEIENIEKLLETIDEIKILKKEKKHKIQLAEMIIELDVSKEETKEKKEIKEKLEKEIANDLKNEHEITEKIKKEKKTTKSKICRHALDYESTTKEKLESIGIKEAIEIEISCISKLKNSIYITEITQEEEENIEKYINQLESIKNGLKEATN